MRLRLTIIVALALMATPVMAQTPDSYTPLFEREVALYRSARSPTNDDAVRALIPGYEALAAAGDTRAMFRLANVAKWLGNSEDMLIWLRRLADLGDAQGQYFLASELRKSPDCSHARGLLEKSAAGGYEVATSSLAFFYDYGICGPVEPAKASIWYEKAARLGIGVAQNNLAFNYLDGKGVKKSRINAYAWFLIASRHTEGGDRRTAEWSPGDARRMAGNIADGLSDEQRTEAGRLAYRLCSEDKVCSKIPQDRRISSPLPPSPSN